MFLIIFFFYYSQNTNDFCLKLQFLKNSYDLNCINPYLDFVPPDLIYNQTVKNTIKYINNFKSPTEKEQQKYIKILKKKDYLKDTSFKKRKKIKCKKKEEINFNEIINNPYNENNSNETCYNSYSKFYYNYKSKNFDYDYKKFKEIPKFCGGRIDAVWTYVDLNDSNWKIQYKEKIGEKIDEILYRNYDSLKYSMRSVYKYISYIKHYYLILSNESQIPEFLIKYKNNSEYKIHFIFHRDIFPKDNQNIELPTFSSNAIESTIAFIPDLSECFIYLNDDLFVGDYLSPGFFVNPFNNKINIFKVPKLIPVESNKMWFKQLSFTNFVFDYYFIKKKRRLNYQHVLHFFRKSVLLETYEKFKIPYSITRKYIKRNIYNIVVYYLFSIYAEIYNYGQFKYRINSKYFNLKNFKNYKNNNKIKLFCVNDYKEKNTTIYGEKILYFKNKMEQIYPKKTPIEN